MYDVLILGGGVIGLSLAYELSGQGQKVHVLDKSAPASEASWAGAGILPATRRSTADDALDQLAGLSLEMHRAWAERLRNETGIDNGFRRSGGIHLAFEPAGAEELEHAAADWRRRQIPVETLTAETLCQREPALVSGAAALPPRAAYFLPEESQLRNPWHMRALVAACSSRGVQISSPLAVDDFEHSSGRIQAVRTASGRLTAERYVLTSGAWTGLLAERLGLRLPIKPIRGQIVLLSGGSPPLRRIVNVGSRYLVPRDDGRVLVGSTEEDAGFQKQNTAEGVAGLLELAVGLAPGLRQAQFERSWSGLRPATLDGLPFLGPIPGFDNAWLAAGHFRGGLTLSTGTARVLGQLLLDKTPEIDLSAFRLDRVCSI